MPDGRGRRTRFTLAFALTALAFVATLGGYRPPLVAAATSPFTDIGGTTFEADIDWLFAEGITVGCTATLYCPADPVTRGQMASFLARMFDLPATTTDYFTDDDGTTHETDINSLAAAEITTGCTATTFCPAGPVSRGQMASFLVRAIPLTAGADNDYFRDDNGTTHEVDIDRAAAVGITTGCGTWRYCPASAVTRGQMAGFLHRVETPVTPPPYPAPSGPQTLHVAIDGADAANACLVEADPCQTIRHAIAVAIDGDTVEVGAGVFREEAIVVSRDLEITGDLAGGTIIDASGGPLYRVMTVPAGRIVTIRRLTITGGHDRDEPIQYLGGGILNRGSLTIAESTVTGNVGFRGGGAIFSSGLLNVDGSTISANAGRSGGGIRSDGDLAIARSTINDNDGGGIAIVGGITRISESAILRNRSSRGGGGIYAGAGSVMIERATIAENTAHSEGLAGHGGAIFAIDATVSISNSTIVGNEADTWSAIDGRSVSVINSTFSANVGGFGVVVGNTGSVLRNVIVAGNFWPGLPGDGDDLVGDEFAILDSIVGIPAGMTLVDILDPAGLQDNGGPTQTIALADSPTNPAIDKGHAATCAAAPVNGLDQRGLPRTPPCDIGAYEIQP